MYLSRASTSSSRSGEPGRDVGADFDAYCEPAAEKPVDAAASLAVAVVSRSDDPQISHSRNDGWFAKVHTGQGIVLGRRRRVPGSGAGAGVVAPEPEPGDEEIECGRGECAVDEGSERL